MTSSALPRGHEASSWTASIALPAEQTSPRAARALLRLALEQWHIGDVHDVDLLLTEVVTNAVVHAHTDLTVQLQARPGWVRAEVQDCSSDPLRRRHVTRRSERGRGLLLLDELSDGWGWDELASGDAPPGGACKSVWFEVTRQGSDAAAPEARRR